MTIFEIINKLSNGGMDGLFSQIYGKSKDELLRQRARFLNCTENFSRLYPLREDVRIFSVPASLILGGEFAPYQHGYCISAAASADILGFVAYHDEEVVRISSDFFDAIEIEIKKKRVNNIYFSSTILFSGNCAKIIAPNISAHPESSFGESACPNITQPASIEKTDSKLKIRDATVGSASF